MARKVYVDVKVRLVINMDEGITVGKVVEELDYNFASTMDEADLLESEILDFEIIDSK